MSRQASAEREKTRHNHQGGRRQDRRDQPGRRGNHHGENTRRDEVANAQTIDGLGSGPANTVIMFPMELRETIKDFVQSVSKKNSETTVL